MTSTPISTHNLTYVNYLPAGTVFVFGSNLAGRHGAGAAYTARTKFGAVYGVGVGPTGQSYALPTKDRELCTLPLTDIAPFVREFRDYCRQNPDQKFFLTEVGCGLAGYTPADMASLFLQEGADAEPNIIYPQSFEVVFRSEAHLGHEITAHER